jgi:hypothetical protein
MTINKNLKKIRFRYFYTLIALLLITYLVIDYRGPAKIFLHQDTAFGFPCKRAKELIVQEYDENGNLWASRGMIVYELKNGEDKFRRVAHVPTGISLFWLRNFTLLRRATIRPECIETVVNDKGDITALSAGRLWYLHSGSKKFRETKRLTHYGFGDQGVRNDGLIDVNDTIVFLGEYFRNMNLEKVRIFKGSLKTMQWQVAYEFLPGCIRHIHAIQEDPYSHKLWVCTGDENNESGIAWSDDSFKTLAPIGSGSQEWRTCQLVFDEDAVYWGTDTKSEDIAGIYKWNKNTGKIEKLQKVEGQMFFGTRLANGTIVMSTDREGTPIEKDDKTRLFTIVNDTITSFNCGSWNHNKPGFWFKFAMLRFQRDQGAHSLAITCLNLKEFSDGELIIIPEDILSQSADNSK